MCSSKSHCSCYCFYSTEEQLLRLELELLVAEHVVIALTRHSTRPQLLDCYHKDDCGGLTSEVLPVVILSACQGSLDDEPNYHYNHKEANHTPGVRAGVQLCTMLGKEQKIVDHGPQLQVVVNSPGNLESPKQRRPEHEEPLLNNQSDDANNDRKSNGSKDRNIDVRPEERDIDGS